MELKYIFGPVPSRRLGKSLGISPIPRKTCNYSCIYCQLGRTDKMTEERKEFFPLEDIINEFKQYLKETFDFDVITIVGEGEPTLYLKLGELIKEVKKISDKPVAVITNGALLSSKEVRDELMNADIVLPSIDGYNEETAKKIDRPLGTIHFKDELEGLIEFSKEYKGQLLLEIMLISGINCDKNSIEHFKEILKKIKYDKVYLNTPVRPPAENFVKVVSQEEMKYAVEELGGISIDMLSSGEFFSEIEDSYEAILNIIRRHPMNQFEINSFLESRKEKLEYNIFDKLENDEKINCILYKGIKTYRLK
ncbi:radical SAM protein [uncultured Fusobacterium sp.]|jgi:wyosine [tRNA(Phe)-imidazoG37] synthetase (radical SAM superfamily)|uniref:radical SAM protein n=1 Tax=uncultured Fusobacterium sp. TaxID=159267 RepID=UPI0025E62C1E|nr:radical SAM protein [uncultured Fusobacterium sp.]